MSQRVVVDASLAVKWLVSEVDSQEAWELARSWASEGKRLTAPHLMPVEVASALYRRVVRQELSLEVAIRLMDRLVAGGVELHETGHLHRRAMALARELQQPAVYDAHYLALAELLNCEMWTADERFYRAAKGTFDRLRLLGEFQTA